MWIYTLAGDLSDEQRKTARDLVDSAKATLLQQDVIRFYVANTPGFGHQSATLALARRLVLPPDASGYGFGFSNKIEICYNDQTRAGTLDKIYQLLPELLGKEKGSIGKASVEIVDLMYTGNEANVEFCFCGGYDHIDALLKEGPFINTKFLVLIQPFRYGEGSRFKDFGSKFGNIVLAQTDLKKPSEYKQVADFDAPPTLIQANPYYLGGLEARAFHIPTAEPDEAAFQYLYEACNKQQRNVIWAMENAIKTWSANYWTHLIYGINYPGPTVFAQLPWERLALVLATIKTARLMSVEPGVPHIIFSFSEYKDAEPDASFANILRLAGGGKNAAETSIDQFVASAQTDPLMASDFAIFARERQAAALRRYAAFDLPSGTEKYRIFDARFADENELLDDLSWLAAEPQRVLLIRASFVPPPIFNWFLGAINGTAIFEGNNTAAVAISAGKYYLNVNRAGEVGRRNRYPQGFLQIKAGSAPTQVITKKLQRIADRVQVDINRWPAEPSEDPTAIVGKYIARNNTDAKIYGAYFAAVSAYYADCMNDKFTLALPAVTILIEGSKLDQFGASLDATAPTTLAALYAQLSQVTARGDPVDVLGQIFASGPLHASLASLLKFAGGSLVLDEAAVGKTDDADGAISTVTLTGMTRSLGFAADATLVFTMARHVPCCAASFAITEALTLDGAPWIIFGAPTLNLYVNDAGSPPTVTIDTSIPAADAAITIALPFGSAPFAIEGAFEPAKTIGDFVAVVGGIDLAGKLPGPVQGLAGIGAKAISMSYDPGARRIDEITLTIGTTSSWHLINNLELQSVDAVISILSPGDLRGRTISAAITAVLVLNAKTQSGIEVSASLPDWRFSGQLYGPSLSIEDVISVFWTAAQPGWPGGKAPTITTLSIEYDTVSGAYSGNLSLDLDWPVTIAGKTILCIESIALMLMGGTGYATGSLSGSILVLPNSAKIGLMLTALYNSAGLGWSFEAQQTSGKLSLSDLVKEYIGWDSGFEIGIDALSFKYQTNNGSFQFAARTAGAWTFPVIDLSITGNVTLGYNGGSTKLDGPGTPRGVARVPMTGSSPLSRAHAQLAATPATGYFAKVSADIVWKSIELTVTAELAPSSYQYTVAWGPFSGVLDQTRKTVTIKFAGATSLGGMIETFVSWVTGSSFGLVAPWNVLDKIPLADFDLVWDFGKNTVNFEIGIGPIELGIARIDSIGLTYVSEGAKKGAQIALSGQFRWQDDPNEPLAWNAADPASTPAAPGQGNRYLDLRLLAAGQHVNAPDVVAAADVQGAIKALAALPPPKAGEVPSIGFDPETNWLFGTDFGVLRIDSPGDAAAAAKPSYVVTLQVVFNDPVLYGLRLALDGAAAKVFKGLDFQIMYRKLSDTVGVYQAEITLPDLMRRIDVGAYTITLPTFGVEIYTTGDFRFDIGFPWNQNFARSFSVEAIIPPGIPMIGSGGFYFGKLPAVAVSQLPKATNGSFNPNLVFGFGAQLGFGKTVNYGVLTAGISLTVFGIVEGLLAKWNPYDAKNTGSGGGLSLQGQYYFWLQGTFGILGNLYGTVDFVVVKASVNVALKLYVQITFESYKPIPITVYASIDATASLEISLGIFSVTLHFKFSVRIKETIVIGSLQNPADAPWQVEARNDGGRLLSPQRARLRDYGGFARGVQPAVALKWDNLIAPAAPMPLTGYVGFAVTVAGDAALGGASPDLGKQQPCYVAALLIETTAPAVENDRSGAAKARGEVADSSFEALAKMVARWGLAAIKPGPLYADALDALVVTEDELAALLAAIADPEGGARIPAVAIETFLAGQFKMTASMPSQGTATAAFFPMPQSLHLSVPAYSDAPALAYDFSDYNSVSGDFVAWLRKYFDQLQVQVQAEQGEGARATRTVSNETVSVGAFIFGDYFTLLLRQTIQALADGLRDFLYELQAGDTPNDIIDWANKIGGLTVAKTPVSLYDLMRANETAGLTAGKTITLPFVPYAVAEGDSFESIAAQKQFGGAFVATGLATANADAASLLVTGATITYAGNAYQVGGSQSLNTFAEVVVDTPLVTLLADSDVLTAAGVLQPNASLVLPPFPYVTVADDTLVASTARHRITIMDLAGIDRDERLNPVGTSNGDVADLFDRALAPDVHIPHLPQFQIGALIDEAQRAGAFQHLSGMVSRYYLHGLRLPTDKITPLREGMFVKKNASGGLSLPPEAGLFALTGQQVPIPTLIDKVPFSITLSRPASLDLLPWLAFATGDAVAFTVTPGTVDSNFQRYTALRAYAAANVLDSQIVALGAAGAVRSDSMRYPLASDLSWRSAARIAFPTGGMLAVAQPRLWPLPSAMMALANPVRSAGGHDPGFALAIQSYNEATGGTNVQPISAFGWASTVQFTIKMLAAGGTGNASRDTYEIVGAGAGDTLVLERILQTVRDDRAFAGLMVGYREGNVGETAPLTAETGPNVTFGISQVNLSTVTRPSMHLRLDKTTSSDASGPNLLNTPLDFVRLLWEASVTRAGGFFLYYADIATGAGLPSTIFDDKGEATLTLLALYPSGQLLAPFVNAVATGDPFDPTSSTLVAVSVARTVTHVVAATDSLRSIADGVLSTVLAVVESNPGLTFADGAKVSLMTGTYLVPSDGAAPGGALAAIAGHFAVPAEAVVAANPRIPATEWQTGLPANTAIRLPRVTLVIGTSPGGTTASSLAIFYGTSIGALAGYNADMTGLLAAAQALNLSTGPVAEFGSKTPEIQTIGATREPLPVIPTDPHDPTYAKSTLQNLYSLLSYRILPNQDFTASNIGLPLAYRGADRKEAIGAAASKVRFARDLDSTERLEYTKSIPYAALITGGRGGSYAGNGRLLQLVYDWNDLYGNKVVTDLDQANTRFGLVNRAPLLVGYDDAIVTLPQWPSISGSWTLKPSGQARTFAIALEMSFDPSPFNPSSVDQAKAWINRAKASLLTLGRMIAQYTDPNGIAFSLETALLPQPLPIPADQIGTTNAPPSTLVGWLGAIRTFLVARAAGNAQASEPSVLAFAFAVVADFAAITTAQIFPMTLLLRIARPAAVAQGDYAAVPGIRDAGSLVAPKSDVGGTGDALRSFARAVRDTLEGAGPFTIEVATGADRHASSNASPAVWGIRFGTEKSHGISFTVTDPQEPEIYAPRPMSNTLISRRVAVRTYSSIDDFDPATDKLVGALLDIDFRSIELDGWVGQFFTSFDSLLSPDFVSSLLVIDARATNLPKDVPSLMRGLIDAKDKLAGIVSNLMHPVFKGQPTTRIASAQEALRQSLLAKLSDLSTIRAAVSYGAAVVADIPDGGEAGTNVPSLLGAIGWTANLSGINGQINFSAPKLPLVAGQNQPLTFLVESAQLIKSGTAGVVDSVDLSLGFHGSAIEHQVGAIPGIGSGYFASSWLIPVLADAMTSLHANFETFALPMILRGFPSTPRMTTQLGAPTRPDASKLEDQTLWTYSFGYGLDFHYEQDVVHGTVEYNIVDIGTARLDDPEDPFTALAQFVTSLPKLQSLIQTSVPGIDATTTDQAAIDAGAQVLGAYLKMASDIAHAAHATGGLLVRPQAPWERGSDPSPYTFEIKEGTQTFETGGGKVTAWVIVIDSKGEPPTGLIGAPIILPDGFTRSQMMSIDALSAPATGVYAYYYVTDGMPLTGDRAQAISGRTIALPGLQILARQDAKATLFIERNKVLVPGRETADAFVYKTPDVAFANACQPTITSGALLDLSMLGSDDDRPVTRTLQDHLTVLFDALFASRFTGDVTLQIGVTYAYALSPSLPGLAIPLPVVLQPPISVAVDATKNATDTGMTLDEMIAALASGVCLWFQRFRPSLQSGLLAFDLKIMSSTTRQTMPLLELTNIVLPTAYVTPPPASGEK